MHPTVAAISFVYFRPRVLKFVRKFHSPDVAILGPWLGGSSDQSTYPTTKHVNQHHSLHTLADNFVKYGFYVIN
jgi:hypothetical protein